MSKHRERIGRLVTWIKRHMDQRTPLIVYHGEGLPATPPVEIDAAEAEGRRVLHVHFVKPSAPGIAPEVEKPRPASVVRAAEVM